MEEEIKRTLKVNGTDVSQYKEFAYDGCHKIYLMPPDDEKARQEMIKNGYQIIGIHALPEKYINSCSLRFIDRYDLLGEHVVKQSEAEVVFEGFDQVCLEEDDYITLVDGKIIVTWYEEVKFVVTLTVSPNTNADHVMSILNDRAYDIDGVEDFDYAEQEVI